MSEIDEDKPCKRGCCWTPYGHSTVRDREPKGSSKRCVCHVQVVPRTEASTFFEDLMRAAD